MQVFLQSQEHLAVFTITWSAEPSTGYRCLQHLHTTSRWLDRMKPCSGWDLCLCWIVFIKHGSSSTICKYCDHCRFIHSPIQSMVYHSSARLEPREWLLLLHPLAGARCVPGSDSWYLHNVQDGQDGRKLWTLMSTINWMQHDAMYTVISFTAKGPLQRYRPWPTETV